MTYAFPYKTYYNLQQVYDAFGYGPISTVIREARLAYKYGEKIVVYANTFGGKPHDFTVERGKGSWFTEKCKLSGIRPTNASDWLTDDEMEEIDKER